MNKSEENKEINNSKKITEFFFYKKPPIYEDMPTDKNKNSMKSIYWKIKKIKKNIFQTIFV